jgi:hypothetical protein
VPNPFIPFQIATGEQFVDRAVETQTILERVSKGANSAVVGNPHIGKSSLLMRLRDPWIVKQFVREPARYLFVEVDFQSFVPADRPADFWAYVVEEINLFDPGTEGLFKPITDREAFDSRRLLSAFTRLGQSGRRLVLLIDEFDYLFNLPNFKTLDFMGPLRVFVMKSDGLTLVTASRLSVADLNRYAAEYKDQTRGSDLFNYLEEIPLGSFTPLDVKNWLENHFQDQEVLEEMRLLAGHHPLLLQLAGELYFEAELSTKARRQEFRNLFARKAESQFQDVWDYLTSKAQVALVIFALDNLSGQIASGEKFSLEKAGQYLTWYASEVRDMTRRGTLEVGPTGRPGINSLAFLLWVAENKIVGTRGDEPQDAFAQWLTDKQYKLGGLLTQEEIAWLQKTWQSIPDGLIDLARKAILPKGWQ